MRKSQWQAADRRVNKGKKGRREGEVEMGGHCQSLGLMMRANIRTHTDTDRHQYASTPAREHTTESEVCLRLAWRNYWLPMEGKMWLIVRSRFSMTALNSCAGGVLGWGLHVTAAVLATIWKWCPSMQRFVKGTLKWIDFQLLRINWGFVGKGWPCFVLSDSRGMQAYGQLHGKSQEMSQIQQILRIIQPQGQRHHHHTLLEARVMTEGGYFCKIHSFSHSTEELNWVLIIKIINTDLYISLFLMPFFFLLCNKNKKKSFL